MTRRRDERTPAEEELLGIERLTPEQEERAEKERAERLELRQNFLIWLLQKKLLKA